MYTPQFPYKGNQVIISSGRTLMHSYDDFAFIFGKKGVAISSPTTFTVDAGERAILASPKIELGYQAEKAGEPILLGRTTTVQLNRLLIALQEMSDALNKIAVGEEDMASAVAEIVKTTKVLSDVAKSVNGRLQTDCLSKNTYTK
jgi:hypothetical protein